AKTGSVAAFGVALAYLASSICAVLMPPELQGRPDVSPHQFWMVLAAHPLAHLAFHWSWVAAGIFGLGAVPAISLLVWSANPGRGASEASLPVRVSAARQVSRRGPRRHVPGARASGRVVRAGRFSARAHVVWLARLRAAGARGPLGYVMKAARLHALRQPLRIDEVTTPVVARDEVLIRIAGAGVCHSDLHI